MLSFIKSYPKISIVLGIGLIIILVFVFRDAIRNHKPNNEILDTIEQKNTTTVQELRVDSIKQRGKLIAITHNNTTGYFIYKGLPMGIHHDMLDILCKKLDVDLKLIVEDDLAKALEMINSGKADILAIDLTYTKERSKSINFTLPVGYNRQVIVQRKKAYGKHTKKTKFLKRAMDLDGHDVYIQKGAIFKSELKHIEEITGSAFTIIEDSTHTQEELILMVSAGKIDYTVSDERIAMANQTFTGNLDFHIGLTVEQKLCWAVPPTANDLKDYINNWLVKYTKSTNYAILTKRYFKTQHSRFYTDKKNLPARGGHLSPFDNTIKKYAKELGWDWRLLASMIYQESRFNPKTVSWTGAQGLMQLMPNTAKRFHLTNPLDPEANIKAGVAFLKWIERQFDDGTMAEEEKVKFMLASYNVGLGHVFDARKLAKKYGKNEEVWTSSTDTFIVLKANPKYYQDPVVKHGYCRGQEPYHYVEIIMERYEDYKNLVNE